MPVQVMAYSYLSGENGEIYRRTDSGLDSEDYKGKKIYLLAIGFVHVKDIIRTLRTDT